MCLLVPRTVRRSYCGNYYQLIKNKNKKIKPDHWNTTNDQALIILNYKMILNGTQVVSYSYVSWGKLISICIYFCNKTE